MNWFNWIIIIPIRLYQYLLSPLLGKNCRFQPSCSNYMIEAVKEWGVFYGVFLGLKRIRRCHPWGGHGNDAVPKRNKQ
ncbi:MAG: membrane protein insertion efficiency factor YidD [Saprospiraceae bacterium]|nr:membrane protein insertion efficiency factor YidD [Candidatus Vicinibacter affinis]